MIENSMDKAFKTAWIVCLAFYIVFNSLVLIKDKYINYKAWSFDTDKNGFVDKDERSKESKEWMAKAANDTRRTFAPFVLIPVSIIAGTTAFFLVVVIDKIKKV